MGFFFVVADIEIEKNNRKKVKSKTESSNIHKHLDDWLNNCLKDNSLLTTSSEFLDNTLLANNSNSSINIMQPNRNLPIMDPSALYSDPNNCYQKVISVYFQITKKKK